MKKSCAIVLIFLVVLFSFSTSSKLAKGVTSSWIPANEGFPPPLVTSICIDPTNSKVFYAGTEGGGIYKSIDGGSSWVIINEGLTTLDVFSLAIDVSNTKIIYAGTGEGIFRSEDAGLSWHTLSFDVPLRVNCIAVSPKSTSTIYIGTDEGIFKSTDGGDTWAEANNGLKEFDFMYLPLVYSLVFDPSNPSTLYALTTYGIFKTQNDGLNWVNESGDLKSPKSESVPTIYAAVIDSSNPKRIFIGTSEGVFKSEDGGVSWSRIKALSATIVRKLVAASDCKKLYAATENGLLKSIDYGETWEKLPNLDPPILTISGDPSNSEVLFVATEEGILKSTNSGLSWVPSNKGLVKVEISQIVEDPSNSSALFASTLGTGIYKTTDLGKTWYAVNNGLDTLNVLTIAVCGGSNSVILAGTDNGIFASNNGGESWEKVSKGINADIIYSMVVSPAESQTVYIGTNRGVFKSINSGASWQEANSGIFAKGNQTYLDVISLAVDPKAPLTIYVGTANKGLYKSSDGGNSWASASTGMGDAISPINAIEIDPANPKTIFIGTDGGGILKSNDGGSSWSTLDNVPSPWVYAIKIDPTNPNVIYAAFSTEGAFKSGDGGKSWTYIDLGLFSKEINSIMIHSSNRVFLCTQAGPYMSVNNYTISASANSGGTISPSGTITVNSDESKTFIITPNSGYKTSDVKVDGVSVGVVPTYTFSNITQDHIISATFEKQITETIIILQIGNKNFTVNGETKTLDSPPIIKNSRTLLPIRTVVEALGGTVDWNNTERKVKITLKDTTIELWIGKSTAKVNGVSKPTDSTNSKVIPEIINSRTMLPLRFVTENLGATVEWNDRTKTITITYKIDASMTNPESTWPPVVGPEPSYRVAAFYYPWYRTPEVDKYWDHWGDGTFLPPLDIASDFYPVLGTYSIANPAVLAQHFAWLRKAGVGIIISSWWGQGSREDQAVALMLKVAERYGIKVAFHIEPYVGRTAERLVSDIKYLYAKYGNYPAFYRSTASSRWSQDARSKGLFFVWAIGAPDGKSAAVEANYWQKAIDAIHNLPDGGLVIANTTESSWVDGGHFDGLYNYATLNLDKSNGFVWARGLPPGAWYVPSVLPGFSARRIGYPAEDFVPRNDGVTYEAQWRAALDVGVEPAFVTITTFNEWHEGTQIEPAVVGATNGRGYTYNDYGAISSEGYLTLTSKLVNNFLATTWPQTRLMRIRVTTTSDWTDFYLVSGATWLRPDPISASEEAVDAGMYGDHFVLSQPITRAEAGEKVEMITDILFTDWKSGGTVVFKIERGHLGSTQVEIFKYVGSEPVLAETLVWGGISADERNTCTFQVSSDVLFPPVP